MKVFISYGAAADQVTALRLQALAAVNGLTVFVPPAHTRRGASAMVDPAIEQKLLESEVVLGVIGAGLSESCRHELNAGLSLQKHMVVMTDKEFAPLMQPVFGTNLVVIDPANPHLSEFGMVEHLKAMHAQKDAKNALLALGTLALGLLILAPAEPV